MQLLARHFPAFLALFVPLALIAWLGSNELRRLDVRTERVLDSQAASFLGSVHRAIDYHVDQRARALLVNLPEFGDEPTIPISLALREREADVLDLVLISGDGRLISPRSGPESLGGRPFRWPSQVQAIARAERLELEGDLAAARAELSAWLENRPVGPGEPDPSTTLRGDDLRIDPDDSAEDPEIRARFVLARVLGELGEAAAAGEQFELCVALAAAAGQTERPLHRGQVLAASTGLLAEFEMSRIEQRSGGDDTRAAALMLELASGRHGDACLAITEETLAALDHSIGADSPARPTADAARAIDRVRRDSLRFAREYGLFVKNTVAAAIRDHEPEGPLVVVLGDLSEDSILVLRRLDDDERRRAPRLTRSADWIGLRLDAATVLNDALTAPTGPGCPAFTLAINDATGMPFAGMPHAGADARDELPSIGGLRLAAIPIDPTGMLEERQRTFEERAFLLLALCAVAAVGAFLLLRGMMREAAYSTSRMQFVSQITHELKTPLALIRMYGETLERGRANDQQQASHFAGIITREADHLTTLVDRVLSFARGTRSNPDTCTQRTDLSTQVTAIAEDYHPHLSRKGIGLELDLAAGIDVCVDPDQLTGALLALLENAAKYSREDTPDQSIRVSVSRHRCTARIEVADRGIGIPRGEHAKIFDGWYRGSNSGSRRGAGLGLSMVQRFAKSHRGRAEACLRDGGGTIVRITLPICDENDDDVQG